MHKQEIHRTNNLFGFVESNTTINGYKYIVAVEPNDIKKESDLLFHEITIISSLAIRSIYGSFDPDPTIEIAKSTFSKAKARIDLGMFERGKQYVQEITSESINRELKPKDDEYIKEWVLKGLKNLRKNSPLDYKRQKIDIDGICAILGIETNALLFNLGILVEEGIAELANSEHAIERGEIFITSLGIRNLDDFITKQKDSKDISLSYSKTEIYDIALSFAGEDRQIAEQIAIKLKENGVKVFYDSFEKENLWGKNLYDYLSDIYSNKARYCIMLLSKNYKDKLWTNLERQSAQSKAFKEQKEYILPIRIDDTKIPGIHETVGYIEWNKTNINTLIEMIIIKLKENI